MRYPSVHITLVESDLDPFSLVGMVVTALRQANVPRQRVLEFVMEAMADGFDHLIDTILEWVVDDSEEDIRDDKFWYYPFPE